MNITFSTSFQKDLRRLCLKEYLEKDGYAVVFGEECLSPDFKPPADALILLPIPPSALLLEQLKDKLTPFQTILGGKIPKDFAVYCRKNKIHVLDYLNSPSVTIKNAIATAEGAICEAIQTAGCNLHHSRILVIGYGNCGEILCDKLKGLCVQVSVSTRSPSAQAKAISHGCLLHKDSDYPFYDLIFNTAPALVINRDVIDKLSSDCVIIDIASAPGGTDFDYCTEKNICARLCLGLPGKYSPKTSAQILYEHIRTILCQPQ